MAHLVAFGLQVADVVRIRHRLERDPLDDFQTEALERFYMAVTRMNGPRARKEIVHG